MGYSGTTGGEMMNAPIIIGILILIAAVAFIVWMILRKSDGDDRYEEPEKESREHAASLAAEEKKKEPEKKTEPEREASKKRPESAPKRDAAVTYGRGMAKKKKEETEEKEWETEVIYSYYGRKDIWRCIYCDGENLASSGICHVCGREREEL